MRGFTGAAVPDFLNRSAKMAETGQKISFPGLVLPCLPAASRMSLSGISLKEKPAIFSRSTLFFTSMASRFSGCRRFNTPFTYHQNSDVAEMIKMITAKSYIGGGIISEGFEAVQEERLEKHSRNGNYERRKQMLIVTSETISGKNFEMLGLVKGSTIQTVNAIKDIGSGLKTLVGGELGNYNKMMEKARETATARMVEEAEKLGADAIISMRYSSSSVMQSAAEVLAYGTAVKYV